MSASASALPIGAPSSAPAAGAKAQTEVHATSTNQPSAVQRPFLTSSSFAKVVHHIGGAATRGHPVRRHSSPLWGVEEFTGIITQRLSLPCHCAIRYCPYSITL